MDRREISVLLVSLSFLAVSCGSEPSTVDDGGNADAASGCVTCSEFGAECGTISDGCGGTLDCGGCEDPEICGGGGTPNVCGEGECEPQVLTRCTPTTGPEADVVWMDSCGEEGEIAQDCPDAHSQCVDLSATESACQCLSHWEGDRCDICPPQYDPDSDCVDCLGTCDALGYECGIGDDGCGGELDCGECDLGQICGTSENPNICVPFSCEHASWDVDTVEEGYLWSRTSMALDDEGGVHLVYADWNRYGALRYSYLPEGETWSHEEVISNGGQNHFSIAVDSDERAHISSYNSNSYDLHYAIRSAEGWEIETIATEGDVGAFNSIQIDGEGGGHLCYYDDEFRALMYGYRSPDEAWRFEIGDEHGSPGHYASMRVDRDLTAHVSHLDFEDYSETRLRYSYKHFGEAWQHEDVNAPGTLLLATSLYIDHRGDIHISYEDDLSSSLMYAHRSSDDGRWYLETVETPERVMVVMGRSIVVDPTGAVHIVVQGSTSQDILHAFRPVGGEWAFDVIGVGTYPSMNIDDEGRLHVVYSNLIDIGEAHIMYSTSDCE